MYMFPWSSLYAALAGTMKLGTDPVRLKLSLVVPLIMQPSVFVGWGLFCVGPHVPRTKAASLLSFGEHSNTSLRPSEYTRPNCGWVAEDSIVHRWDL
jgi:hypothetical protein